MTDSEIAAAAAVNQSTVSRWTKRKGFPGKLDGYRDRGEVVDFLDGVLVGARWRVSDGGELEERLPSVGAREGSDATYGDRLRAAWNLRRREQRPAAVTRDSGQLSVVRGDAVAREVVRLWRRPSPMEGDTVRQPPLLGLAGLLLAHQEWTRHDWVEAFSEPRDDGVDVRADSDFPLSARFERELLGSWRVTSAANDRRRLFEVVREELSKRSFVSGSEGAFLDQVLAQTARIEHAPFFGEEFYTPSVVADLMTGIAMWGGAKTVYAPACGTGELAWSALARLEDGAAITAHSLTTSGRHLLRAGIASRLANARVRVDPATRLTPGRLFDVVIMNPPSQRGGAVYSPPTAHLNPDSVHKWVQLARASMAGTSRAVIIMPTSASSSRARAERQLREELLTSGMLRAVIDLPKGVFPQARAAMSIWILARGPRRRNAEDVLLVSSTRLTDSSRGGVRYLRPAVAAALATALSRWLDGHPWRPPHDVEGKITSARLIASRGANLNYDPAADAPAPLFAIGLAAPDAAAATEKIRSRVEAVVERHADTLALEPLTGEQEFAVSLLSEVCNLQAGPASQIKKEDLSRVERPGAVTVIEPEMVGRDGGLGEPVAWLADGRFLSRRYTVAPGDLLLTRIGRLPRIAMVQNQAGWVQGRGVLRIRVEEGFGLKPEFLLYYLRHSALTTTWLKVSDSTASPSISVRALAQVRVPIPTAERQDRYVAAVRAYAELQLAAEKLRAEAAVVQDQLLAHMRSDS